MVTFLANQQSCPECGSVALQYVGTSNFNLGRAAIGSVIAGPVGAVLGGTSGQRNVNAVCQACGHIFDYQLTQRNISVARLYLGVNLDFSKPDHRLFYKIASGDLRKCGRLNVSDPVNVGHRWEIFKRHAVTSGLSYDTSFVPAGAEQDVIDTKVLPQRDKGWLEELSDSLVKLSPYALVISLVMLSAGSSYWWVPISICFFYYILGVIILLPMLLIYGVFMLTIKVFGKGR